ncbi:hypothetical protein [Intrasporangium sp. DVR]|uniref:hypothetical protein n=1 Tax=Intrasporangium sp. DVR TaxID=3127867 RepID=UPI00313A5DEC
MEASSWTDDPWPVGDHDDDPVAARWSPGPSAAPDRTVSYVVLVDGRVVDAWDESLWDSPWRHDPRVDRSRRPWREEPPRPSEPRPWVATLQWLEHVVGGAEALATLTTESLPDEDFQLPEGAVGDGDVVARFRRAVSQLDLLAEERFDSELRTAFRRALADVGLEVFRGSPATDPAQVAAVVCWLVLKANGLKPPMGPVTQKELTTRLGLASFPTSRAQAVIRLLGAPQPPWVRRPHGLIELEPLSRTDLLLSRTRREIVSLRDAARAAEAQAVTREAQAQDLELHLRHVS